MLGYAPERVERPARGARPRCSRPSRTIPYALVGADGVAAAVEWFKERVGERLAGAVRLRGRRRGEPAAPDGGRRPAPVGRGARRRWPAATCARGGAVCVVGFRALKDFHAALLADNARALGPGVQARGDRARPRVPEGRADVERARRSRARFDDPAFRGAGRRAGGRPPARGRARRRSRPCSASPTRTAPGPRSSTRLGRAGLRGPDAAAVGPGHARVRDPARGAAARGRHASCSTTWSTGAERGGRARDRAAHARRPARGAPRRGLGRARHRRLRLRRARARLALDGARDGARAAGHRRARPGRGALPPRLLRRPSDRPRRRRRRPRAAPGRRGRRAACSRTCWWRARRSPGPSRGARSRATGISLATGYRAAELVLAASTRGRGRRRGAERRWRCTRATTCSARC